MRLLNQRLHQIVREFLDNGLHLSQSVDLLQISTKQADFMNLYQSVEFENNGLMTVGRVPSSLFASSDLLVAVLYSRNIYHSVKPSSLRPITPVLSLNIY